jgi:hypothetical protein
VPLAYPKSDKRSAEPELDKCPDVVIKYKEFDSAAQKEQSVHVA